MFQYHVPYCSNHMNDIQSYVLMQFNYLNSSLQSSKLSSTEGDTYLASHTKKVSSSTVLIRRAVFTKEL